MAEKYDDPCEFHSAMGQINTMLLQIVEDHTDPRIFDHQTVTQRLLEIANNGQAWSSWAVETLLGRGYEPDQEEPEQEEPF